MPCPDIHAEFISVRHLLTVDQRQFPSRPMGYFFTMPHPKPLLASRRTLPHFAKEQNREGLFLKNILRNKLLSSLPRSSFAMGKG